MADTHPASHDHAHSVAPPNTHGAHDDAAHVRAHLRKYKLVGLTLIAFTLGTVGLAYVPFHSHSTNILVGLLVATFKVCLVGAFFMHLLEERVTIWRFLIFTFIFVCGLFFLTLL